MSLSNKAIQDFCQSQIDLYPHLRPQYEKIQSYCIQRLWYQLTQFLIEFINDPKTSSGQNYVDLCKQLLCNIRKKVTKTAYCRVLCAASMQLYPDYNQSLNFLKTYGDLQQYNIVDQIEELDPMSKKNNDIPLYKSLEDGYLLIMIQAAFIFIHMNNMQLARNYLDAAFSLIQKLTSVENIIYSNYYYTYIFFYKTFGPYENIYLNGLKYFSYIQLEDSPEEERVSICCDTMYRVNIETEYSFGELLLSPVYKYVDNLDDYRYISQLLSIVYNGNVSEWTQYKQYYHNQIQENAILRDHMTDIEEKIKNMSLIELAFHRSSHDRILSYQEISTYCHVDMQDMENFIIHCMSLHLIQGYLNDEKQTLTVTSIQPRILDKEHLNSINHQLQNWILKLNNIIHILEEQTNIHN